MKNIVCLESTQKSQLLMLPKENQSHLARRLIQRLCPDVSYMKNKVLLIFWLIAITCVFVLMYFLQSQSTQFFGLVSGREQAIRFQYPVDIVNITVVDGEEVAAGRVLLEVKRFDLPAQVAIIDDKRMEIQVRHQENIAKTNAKRMSLAAKQKARLTELDIEITRLSAQLKLNQNLGKKLIDQRPETLNVLQTQIYSLKSARQYTYDAYQAQIDNLESQLQSVLRPANAQLAKLEKQKSELLRQQSALNVTAKFNGSIGSVLYKAGETVKPFESIITLHSSTPNTIKGYIHEAVESSVQIGQTVWVTPLVSADSTPLKGRVVSLGNRMVEYPDRLKRHVNVLAYGREVMIKLMDNSPLLMNEKVSIELQPPQSFTSWLHSQPLLAHVKTYLSKLFSA